MTLPGFEPGVGRLEAACLSPFGYRAATDRLGIEPSERASPTSSARWDRLARWIWVPDVKPCLGGFG